MKILQLSNSDLNGGAAVASYRLHKALLNSSIDSKMLVNEKKSHEVTIINKSSSLDNIKIIIKNRLIFQLRKLMKIKHPGTISLNFFPSNILKKIKEIDHDIIHLHWVNNEMLSINQISKITKPLIWTFHDMWPICGIEHYSDTTEYKDGYKKKKINKKIKIVCVSDWLAKKVKESYLFNKFEVHTIPPCINIKKWKNIEKNTSRSLLGFDLNEKIIIFSSANGTSERRKGFDLLLKALDNEHFKKDNYRLVIIGKINDQDKSKIPINYTNYLLNTTDDELIFRLLYSAADLMAIPSRLETFGQSIIEAASCGTPSIGFKNTGVQEAIKHKETGYLADYNNTEDLFNGVKWCFKEIKDKNNDLGIKARKNIEQNFSYEYISQKYLSLYENLLKK
tara:strand:+ start:89 stop:1270 length:1182 start_codon:yes stop_codon:yes gene_type:complete